MNDEEYKEIIDIYNKIAEKYQTPEESFEVFDLLSSKLKIKSINKNTRKFDLRGENTPSVTCYGKLTYVDFGAGDGRRNIVHLIRENNKTLSFKSAVLQLAEWLKEDVELLKASSIGLRKQEETKKAEPYKEKYIQDQIDERNKIENKELFLNLINGLCRSCSIEEKRAAVKAFNIGLNYYDSSYTYEEGGEQKTKTERQYRLFIPEYDQHKVPYGSFRYNREYKDNKGLLRKNCQRVLFGSHLLPFYKKQKPLIFSEGHSDTIVNVSKYLQCVTSGSSTTPLKAFLPLLKGFLIHFFPDADQPGIKGVSEKILEIEEYNKELPEEEKIKYQVFLWGIGWKEKNIEDFQNMLIPLSEIDTLAEKYSKAWWRRHFTDETLTPNIELDIIEKEQNHIFNKKIKDLKLDIVLPDCAYVKNWKILQKDILQQGFDFIDFHLKHGGTDKYNNFIKTYKFKG